MFHLIIIIILMATIINIHLYEQTQERIKDHQRQIDRLDDLIFENRIKTLRETTDLRHDIIRLQFRDGDAPDLDGEVFDLSDDPDDI